MRCFWSFMFVPIEVDFTVRVIGLPQSIITVCDPKPLVVFSDEIVVKGTANVPVMLEVL